MKAYLLVIFLLAAPLLVRLVSTEAASDSAVAPGAPAEARKVDSSPAPTAPATIVPKPAPAAPDVPAREVPAAHAFTFM